jgi:predicted NBD/HSP70 family sugar kinase
VLELLRLGLLVELGAAPSGRVGRPHSRLALNRDSHCGIGLEVNVDYVAVAVSDLLHQVRFHRVEAVDNRDVPPVEVLERAARLVRVAVEAAAAEGLRAAGVGVAAPGAILADSASVLVAPNLGWAEVAVVDELEARLGDLGIRVAVENEANLAALGELWLGIGGESGDYVHVSGEIGVGAGLVVGGALFRGARGLAGEIGHVVVDPAGPECACGGRGCLERFAGQEAILTAAGLPTTTATTLGRAASPLRELIGKLDAGDAAALAAVRAAADALGVGIASVVNVVDPDTIVLGGSYASLAPWLVEPLQQALSRQVLASRWRPVAVRASALGPDAAVRGAAAWVVQGVLAAPDAVAVPAG